MIVAHAEHDNAIRPVIQLRCKTTLGPIATNLLIVDADGEILHRVGTLEDGWWCPTWVSPAIADRARKLSGFGR